MCDILYIQVIFEACLTLLFPNKSIYLAAARYLSSSGGHQITLLAAVR